MPNKILVSFLASDVLFLLTGGLLIGFALMSEKDLRANPDMDSVAQHLLLKRTPLTAAVVNAIFIFIAFALSLPGFFIPTNRGWFKAHGWMVTLCGVFTLAIGSAIWIETLRTRSMLGSVWAKESEATQSLLQEKFNCCGYDSPTSPPFIQDSTCTSTLVAARKGGCIGPFSSFANQYLDVIFTAMFGAVGLDAIVVLCVTMVLKDRQEQARYRHIDEKNGMDGI
ncbi:uncharacterized protein K452DRAFT_292222 [Aplosporella prunicola CBS 121167]|uniref:Tetraspanin n=1 Tax=Aplosporella prunicola CBS 121167 TaxID=1176127 RepID=A0A6A6B1L4_9PEZI|nr:uncharacterized protein K452DRAFT_292222 [Aplosporella prunicola CBS 121167]KAF2136621.1 hypothetical protein K452DRAFT_292222 [Aplosporella prunicola CBS 121167]